MFDATLIIAAVAVAMVYVLASYGLIVTYRVGGVFNFALGYQGALAAFVYWQCVVEWGIGKHVAAALVVLVFAPVTGFLIQKVLFRRRRDTLASIIITIGLGVAIAGLIQLLWEPGTVRTAPSLFGDGFFRFLGTSVTYNEIGVVALTLVIGTLVWLLLNVSRTGISMRAVVDDPDLAGATGIPGGRVSAIAWMIGSMLASIAGVLLAPLINLEVAVLAALVVNAFAVVAFAGLKSLPLVLLGSLLLAYIQGLTDKYQNHLNFIGGSPRSVVPFVMLVIVLLLHPAARQQVRVIGGSLQQGLRERASGTVGWAIALAIGLSILASALSSSWAFTATQAACYALAALSLVLLVGGSAQISLCTATFMGLGAVTMGKMLEAGAPWIVALLAGTVLAAVAGLVVALTAFRLRGLFLALVTYAFAYAAMILIFQNDRVIGVAGLFVGRPELFGIDFNDDRAYLALTVVFVVIVLLAVGALLRGPWGRALQTLSAGDAVADVSGLPVRRWKMAIFAVSSGLAGLAGGLFAAANLNVTGESFTPEASLTLLVFAVVGGITTPAGAVVAGVLAQASDDILQLIVGNAGAWSLLLFGVMAMQTAIMYPAGMGGMLPRRFPTASLAARVAVRPWRPASRGAR